MAIGTIQLRRAKVNPFTDKQIALLGTFADQAVIAIENVRLFEAEQQRTRELSESLQQQTATSEVLQHWLVLMIAGAINPKRSSRSRIYWLQVTWTNLAAEI